MNEKYCQSQTMAFKFGQKVWRCSSTIQSIQNVNVTRRCIIIPADIGEPTRTNQEVIQALTCGVIGGIQ